VASLALADRQVERLIDAARRAGTLERTTFIVVSDHGFHTAKRLIRPAALLRERGVEGPTVISEGGTAMIYGKVDPQMFHGVEGISEVVTPEKFAAYGYPPAGGRMADLVLAAADGYAFNGDALGPVVGDVAPGTSPGNHGYLTTNTDMRPIFVAWGAGVKAGTKLTGVRTVDIAPTVAKLLGVKMGAVDGKPVL
jgi:arylsulfatase A-like enzyme